MEKNNSVDIRYDQSSETIQACEERNSRLKRLEILIHEMISKSVKELCFEYRYEKRSNPSSNDTPKIFISIQRPDEEDIHDLALALPGEGKQLGRKIKNPITGEKVACFDIPEDFDVEGIKNIEEIKDRLGKWRIQRRQRNSRMNDTYYCHLATRHTFRSMPEVLNFIIHGPQKKRNASDVASTSQSQSQGESQSPPKKQRKAKGKEKGKQVITSQEESSSPSPPPSPPPSEITKFSNLELSIVPWTPLGSQMNMHMHYCDQSPKQIEWRPQPLSICLYDPQPSKAMDNFVDLTEESDDDENGIMTEVTQDKVDNSISESPPLKNFVDINLLEMFDHFANMLGGITFEDLLGEITPRTNVQEITGKENQALMRTDPVVESLTITACSNLQENCGAAEKFATLEEAKQKLACVELEGVVDDDDHCHFQHGLYVSMPNPENHILDYDFDYNDDVIGFLFRD